jgi:hypothetical protein
VSNDKIKWVTLSNSPSPPCSSPAPLRRWISSPPPTAPPQRTKPTAPQLPAWSTPTSPPSPHHPQSGLGGGLPRTRHLLLSPPCSPNQRRRWPPPSAEGTSPRGSAPSWPPRSPRHRFSRRWLQSSLPVRTLDPLCQTLQKLDKSF